MVKRFFIAIFISALVLLALPQQAVHAQQTATGEFTDVSSSCEAGEYTVVIQQDFLSGPVNGNGSFLLVNGFNNTTVAVWDEDGTFLGMDEFFVYEDGTFSGTVNYSQAPAGSYVTFRLYFKAPVEGPVIELVAFGPTTHNLALEPQVVGSEEEGSPIDENAILLDTAQAEVNCDVVAPGCDVQISLAGAVSGAFTQTTATYWEPSADAMTSPPVIIEAGKTYYVFGQDASESYYKVLLQCTFLWVPKDTVGPNYDDVWNGAPLPTTIVE
jgi:hypothetical protein